MEIKRNTLYKIKCHAKFLIKSDVWKRLKITFKDSVYLDTIEADILKAR